MKAQLTVKVGQRAARAILVDGDGRLVLIKRTKPGWAPYWTAPGGGLEGGDVSVEAALFRELAEELGAEVDDASRGGYDIDRINLHSEDLERVDLKPEALKEFILANRDALLAEVSAAG